ncbi:MAG: TolC family protein [Bacteroidetes bacterium]|nr:TolC family protein [Bacteroidota bacterium]
MKQLILICVAFVFGCSLNVSGQGKVRFITLSEAIEIAKANSPDALNAKQNFRTSYWEFRSYQASNLPALGLTSTLPNLNQGFSTYQDSTGNRTYVRSQYITTKMTLGLTQQIGITGGSISVNSSLEGSWNQEGYNPYPFLSVPVNVVFNQPLFTFNKFRWDRKIQPLKYSQAKRKYLEDIEQISITTIIHFFTLLQAQVDQKIARVNLSNYDTMYRIAKGRFQLGKIAENDLLQMELNFLKEQAAVENADLNLENAQFRLKSYLRIQDTSHVRLVAPDEIGFFTIDPSASVALAVEYSSTSLDFKKRLLEAARTVNIARMQDRFDANIHVEVGLTKSGTTVPDAYVKPLDNRILGVDISIPILDWGVARGKIKMAQSEDEVVKNSVEQESLDFRQNVYLKAVQFNMQKNQVRIAAKSDTVARKSFEVIKGRYLIGKINGILDLNNAQLETDGAEKSYYTALQTYWLNYYEIRKLTLFDFRASKPLEFDFTDVK